MKTIEFMAEAYEQRLEYRRAHPKLKSMELFYEMQKNYYRNILRAKQENRPIAWQSVLSPVELLHAMDIVPFIPEGHAINIGISGAEEYFQIGEGYGISAETCSTHRVAMGMAVAGVVPTPDFIINTAHACDSGIKTYENFSKYFNKPTFFLDRAYRYDKDAIEFYKEEIGNLIEFLEENTGRKLDYQRLVECCKRSHESFGYWADICNLRKNRPSPVGGRDAFRDRGVNMIAAGLPEAVEYFEVRYNELKAKANRGEGAIPNEEYRLFWMPSPVFHEMKLMDWMENEHNTIVALDTFNNPAKDFRDADPTDPIDYLAKKSYSDMLGRTTYGDIVSGRSLEAIYELCREWHADGVVFFAHFSCKNICGLLRIFKDGIEKTLDIPTLILEGDNLDSRVVSGEQMRTRLNEFLSMLKAKDDPA